MTDDVVRIKRKIRYKYQGIAFNYRGYGGKTSRCQPLKVT